MFKNDRTYLVEVKATKEKKFYFRKAVREQLDRMKQVAVNNVILLPAIKYKHKGWKKMIVGVSIGLWNKIVDNMRVL